MADEQNNLPLWIPVIFALGISFYFSFCANYAFSAFLLLIFAIFLAVKLRSEFKSLIAIAIALFLSGFLWSKFYDEKFIAAPIIKSDVYGTVIGKVEFIREYENGARTLTISKLNIYETRFKEKPAKPAKKKRHKKNNAKLSEKPIKISKTIEKTYLNLAGETEIDRELSKKEDSIHFKDRKYLDPPKKINITLRKTNENPVEIGDIIQLNVLLQPFGKPDSFDNFNFNRFNYFNQIGGAGFATSDIKIIEKNLSYDFLDKINFWRYKIAQNIQQDFGKNEQQGVIFIALILGIMDFISNDLMQNIRKSGLAHLLSISGLHLSLAASIFFVSFRFLCTRFEYLTLRFNIKKIAAILAIISSLAYLLLAGAPIPAVRSFFMILVVFLAILFDQNSNGLRSLAFAALVIFIINPPAIFSISFQMSFLAILSLIVFCEFTEKFLRNERSGNIFYKFIYYFLGIIISSIIAQIALAPVVVYYFNNFAIFGIISNLVAIPLTTFIVMPLGFIYLFLMPFHLQFLTLYPLNFALTNIINIANFTANLPYSNLTVPLISTSSLIIMSYGFIFLCLWQQKWRYLGIIPIILGIFLAYKTPRPDVIIDGKMQYFAIRYENEGLFFSKKIKETVKIRSLIHKMGEKDFKTFADLKNQEIYCEYEYCKAKIKGKQLLVLTKRTKIANICGEKYDILINLSKFELPTCIDTTKKIINNRDLAESGNQYLYFEK